MRMNYYPGSSMGMSPFGASPYPKMPGVNGFMGGYQAGPDPTFGTADSMGQGNPLGGMQQPQLPGRVKGGGGPNIAGRLASLFKGKGKGGGRGRGMTDYEKWSLGLGAAGGIADIIGSSIQAKRDEEARQRQLKLMEERQAHEQDESGARGRAIGRFMRPIMQQYGMGG